MPGGFFTSHLCVEPRMEHGAHVKWYRWLCQAFPGQPASRHRNSRSPPSGRTRVHRVFCATRYLPRALATKPALNCCCSESRHGNIHRSYGGRRIQDTHSRHSKRSSGTFQFRILLRMPVYICCILIPFWKQQESGVSFLLLGPWLYGAFHVRVRFSMF